MKNKIKGKIIFSILIIVLIAVLVFPATRLLTHNVSMSKLDFYEVVEDFERYDNVEPVACTTSNICYPESYVVSKVLGGSHVYNPSTRQNSDRIHGRNTAISPDMSINDNYYITEGRGIFDTESKTNIGIASSNGKKILSSKYQGIRSNTIKGKDHDFYFLGRRSFFGSTKFDLVDYNGKKLLTSENAYFIYEYDKEYKNTQSIGLVYLKGRNNYRVYGTDIKSEYPIVNISYNQDRTYGVIAKNESELSFVEFVEGKEVEIFTFNYKNEVNANNDYNEPPRIKIDFENQLIFVNSNREGITIIDIKSNKKAISEHIDEIVSEPNLTVFKSRNSNESIVIHNGKVSNTIDYEIFKDRLISNGDEEYIRINDNVLIFKNREFVDYKFIKNREDSDEYIEDNKMILDDSNNTRLFFKGQMDKGIYKYGSVGKYNGDTVYLVADDHELKVLDIKGNTLMQAELGTLCFFNSNTEIEILEYEGKVLIVSKLHGVDEKYREIFEIVDGKAYNTNYIYEFAKDKKYLLDELDDGSLVVKTVDNNYQEIDNDIVLEGNIENKRTLRIEFDTISNAFLISERDKDGSLSKDKRYLYDSKGTLIAKDEEISNYETKRFEYNSDRTKVTLFNQHGDEVVTLDSDKFKEKPNFDGNAFKQVDVNGRTYLVRVKIYNIPNSDD